MGLEGFRKLIEAVVSPDFKESGEYACKEEEQCALLQIYYEAIMRVVWMPEYHREAMDLASYALAKQQEIGGRI